MNVMTDDSYASGRGQASKTSWQARETLLALQRLANARAQLAALEQTVDDGSGLVDEADPADVAQLQALTDDIERLRPKANGRFGRSSAREKMVQLEIQQWLVLERMGFATFDDYLAALGPAPATEMAAPDSEVLDFARREYRDAERAFLEISALVEQEAAKTAARNSQANQYDGPGADIRTFRPKPAGSRSGGPRSANGRSNGARSNGARSANPPIERSIAPVRAPRPTGFTHHNGMQANEGW